MKTEIAALCVDDRMYTDHIHEWFDHPLCGVGHEGVGTVIEAPESKVFRPGDKVLLSHGGYCGRCIACQNGLSQARIFAETIPVHGLILTKLDGTAKGGIVVAIAETLGLPVKFVGVGEKVEDLAEFDPELFVEALFEQWSPDQE